MKTKKHEKFNPSVLGAFTVAALAGIGMAVLWVNGPESEKSPRSISRSQPATPTKTSRSPASLPQTDISSSAELGTLATDAYDARYAVLAKTFRTNPGFEQIQEQIMAEFQFQLELGNSQKVAKHSQRAWSAHLARVFQLYLSAESSAARAQTTTNGILAQAIPEPIRQELKIRFSSAFPDRSEELPTPEISQLSPFAIKTLKN